MENEGWSLHEKMWAFQQRKSPIYMIGGNHQWQAYSMLRTKYSNLPDKVKELSLKSVLAAALANALLSYTAFTPPLMAQTGHRGIRAFRTSGGRLPEGPTFIVPEQV